ncbi:MAG: chemotaxis protein CheA [Rubrivivax sp.]|nr:chemotaxis protein CheA [Rubrivivax sp.]
MLEALPAFISEAHEQIESLEQLLLQLEERPDDRELLDALFRCAHKVKGSAGIFGLERIVEFTHHVESLLDRVRSGTVALTPALSTLLLRCNDQIRALVDEASQRAHGAAVADAAGDAQRAALVQALQGAGGATAPQPAPAAAPAAGTVVTPEAGTGQRWHVTVQFGADIFRNGMDPLAILQYVQQIGRVTAIACDLAAVPTLEAIDPESCHLGLAFAIDTDRGRDAIVDAFCFVRDDVVLHVIEPQAGAERYLELIEQLPDRPRLGEILLAIGAVTRAQLDGALARQQRHAGEPGPAPRIGEILREQVGVPPVVVEAALAKQQKAREGAPDDGARYIRVQADRLDAVINLLGELVIAGAGASLMARQTGQGALIEATATVGRLVEEIRNGTLHLRMVPIGETFARFRRVVRDTAAQLGKDVALEIVGGETELDKSMVERIADPLMHLVRNGLDHGLETAEARVAAGKPAQGRLVLEACHESGGILIRIRDDGRGITRRKVLERAWERGLLPQGTTPSDDEICRLIFEAGFSTAEQVTNLSGRGVGMDVVRRNIEALRGTVTVHSVEGQGTTIEIRLPLTLAIIDGFLVGVGATRFIVPLESVVEVIENRPDASRIDERGRRVVELRGQPLPVVGLRALYAMESPAPERVSIVVIQSGAGRYGVLVDQLLGQHQTVIKPLGRMFRSLRGISGSSILGNGEVALIVDAQALGHLVATCANPVNTPTPVPGLST